MGATYRGIVTTIPTADTARVVRIVRTIFAVAGPALIRQNKRNVVVVRLRPDGQIIFKRAGDVDRSVSLRAGALLEPNLILGCIKNFYFLFNNSSATRKRQRYL